MTDAIDPQIVQLVGGDPWYANQLLEVLAEMWATALNEGRFPGLSANRPPAPPVLEPAAPSEPPPADAPINTTKPGGVRRSPPWRATVLALVGGDPQRLDELVDTLAQLWRAWLDRQREAPA